MKLKKLTAVLCAAALSAGVLAGCGNTGNGADADAAASAQTESSEGQVSESGSYDKTAIENAGDITITMMVSGTEVENDFETQVLPRMVKEKWPNVTLEVTKLPDDQYYTALKTRLASGECPDIILVQPMYAGSNSCFGLAEAGYLADLSDLDCIKNLYKDVSGMTYEDKVYATPGGVSILGTYYNKDMFEECGITEVPDTWQEFLDACEKLKTAGHQPIAMGDKDQYVMQFGLYQLACNEIYSTNPDFDNQLRSGDTSFTDEGTWDKVLNMYYELYENGYIDASQSLGTGASQAIQAFIDGQAAMTFDGSFNATALKAAGAAGDFERGYFPLPGSGNEVYTATCLSAGQAIYAKSKYIDESKAILDYWHDGESDLWDAYVGSGKVIMTYGEGVEEAPNYDLFESFIALMNDGKAAHWCNQAWPAGTEVTMEEMFSEMIGGQGTAAADITQAMQDKFEDLLDE